MSSSSPPPATLPPGAYDSQTRSLYASCIPVTIFATIAVLLRFYAKRLAKSYVWWDDWLIVIALIIYYALAATDLASTTLWGLGRHVAILDPVKQLTPFLKSLIAYQILYFACQSFIKLSLICLYFRLFNPFRYFRVACYSVMALVVTWFIAMFFATLFNCVPVEYFWNRRLPGGGRCIDLLKFAYGNGITNLLLDVIVLCLPFPMLWKLQLNYRTKISLCFVFILGFFVCAVSIIRISNISAFGSGADPTWGATGIYIWSQVEPACGIIGASLPCMRPLFAKLSSTKNTGVSGNSASNGSNGWARKHGGGSKSGAAVIGSGSGGGRSGGFRSGIKRSQSAAGNGGFARMHEDEEQQPIKLADMGGSLETSVRASNGRGANAGGGRGIYAGGEDSGNGSIGERARERARERGYGNASNANAMQSGDSGDSHIYVHTIIEQEH